MGLELFSLHMYGDGISVYYHWNNPTLGMKNIIIDTDILPVLPWDWVEVKENKTYDSIDVSKLRLYEPKGRTLEEVKEEVKDMKPANWAVLQYLSENPDAVPEEWRKYWLYFYGTSLRGRGGYWRVPSAHWASSTWRRDASWLGAPGARARRVVLVNDSGGLDSAPFDPLASALARIERLEDNIQALIEWRERVQNP